MTNKVALMQPYLLPYLGYFQLISAVDTFVLYDDVQWMKGGWINRNRILVDGRADWMTLPMKKDSLGTNINERDFSENFDADRRRILAKLTAAYRRAPFFQPTMTLIARCFESDQRRAVLFIEKLLREFCDYLGIQTEMVRSSGLDTTNGLRGQDRVIDICRTLGATKYVNAIGGQFLYEREAFAQAGIDLLFGQSAPVEYDQFGGPFVSNLSIVDVLMFNAVSDVREMLTRFELI